jgi:hypothetical protein
MQAIAGQPQRAPDGAAVHYERRRPDQTTLYRLAQQHIETFFADAQSLTSAIRRRSPLTRGRIIASELPDFR